MEPKTIFWLRRDLRLNDNTGLKAALRQQKNVQLLFIFDTTILAHSPKNDARVTFIWQCLEQLNKQLNELGSSLLVQHGNPINVWKTLLQEHTINAVYTNRDYEPQTIARDKKVRFLLESNAVAFHDFKDHVFFEYGEVLKDNREPYTIFTPYKKKWLEKYRRTNVRIPKLEPELDQHYAKSNYTLPQLETIGFVKSKIIAPDYDLSHVDKYDDYRDFPGKSKTTNISHHLRFGTVSIRSLIYFSARKNEAYLSELIWRDFFIQILAHFPHVVNQAFKPKYEVIEWRNDEKEFAQWCKGETGYPIVDAGMRQLNQTGLMHNRVRMITASFLVKHLLIDWRIGADYFAEKLLDFDLAANNGNWQWAAGTGCDAAPYFRVFNPTRQQVKFDPKLTYIKRWIPNFNPDQYIAPMVEHKMARERALDTYKRALQFPAVS